MKGNKMLSQSVADNILSIITIKKDFLSVINYQTNWICQKN